jgi:hypothetical protein
MWGKMMKHVIESDRKWRTYHPQVSLDVLNDWNYGPVRHGAVLRVEGGSQQPHGLTPRSVCSSGYSSNLLSRSFGVSMFILEFDQPSLALQWWSFKPFWTFWCSRRSQLSVFQRSGTRACSPFRWPQGPGCSNIFNIYHLSMVEAC